MGRTSNRAERSAQITAALVQVVAREGVGGATTKRVAAEAGLSPGLLHYHFASKQEMVVAALHALQARLLERMDAGAQGIRPLLRALLDVNAPDDEAVRAWVHLSTEAVRDETVRAAFDDALAALEARIDAALAHDYPGAPPSRRRLASASILATVHGALALAHASTRPVPRGYALAAALQHLAPLDAAAL